MYIYNVFFKLQNYTFILYKFLIILSIYVCMYTFLNINIVLYKRTVYFWSNQNIYVHTYVYNILLKYICIYMKKKIHIIIVYCFPIYIKFKEYNILDISVYICM